MKRRLALALLGACALAALASRARAQDWRPPSNQMPAMPRLGELQGGWQSPWTGAMARASGADAGQVRAVGEAAGGDRARFVRFTAGVFPVATWSDRNGDGTCDLVEIFRDGARVYQLIDADLDGSANVLRVYDASGSLLREERL
ncbi:MAG TPA: hypothetical protein VHG28_12885 [Longimicrobiaceae bacterium]|nr:hypothetical protein [Longimicrobiaceae bacterium]